MISVRIYKLESHYGNSQKVIYYKWIHSLLIYDLIFRTKICFKFVKFYVNFHLFGVTIQYMILIIKDYDCFNVIMLAIPWAVLSVYITYIVINRSIMYLFYFSMICFYLKNKIKRLNLALELWLNSKKFPSQRMKKLMHNLNKIYCEMNQFNNEFWQTILRICLTFHSTITFVLVYMIYSGQFNKKYIISFALYHYLIFQIIVISLYINSSSAIQFESSKTLSLFIQHMYQFKNINSKIKFKVVFPLLLPVISFCSFLDVNVHRKTQTQKNWFHIWKSNNWSRNFVYSKRKNYMITNWVIIVIFIFNIIKTVVLYFVLTAKLLIHYHLYWFAYRLATYDYVVISTFT